MLNDIAGGVALRFCAIGDRLGLFQNLAANGPADAATFARRTAIDERYTREWLEGMSAAGYLEFDGSSACFALPAEHARPLADEGSPLFQGALFNLLTYSMEPFDELVEAFKTGHGVSQSTFNPALYDAMQRSSGLRYQNFLIDTWLTEPGCRRHARARRRRRRRRLWQGHGADNHGGGVSQLPLLGSTARATPRADAD